MGVGCVVFFLFWLWFGLFLVFGLYLFVCLVVGWLGCFTSLHGVMLCFGGCGCGGMLSVWVFGRFFFLCRFARALDFSQISPPVWFYGYFAVFHLVSLRFHRRIQGADSVFEPLTKLTHYSLYL